MKPLLLRAPYGISSGYATLIETIALQLPKYNYDLYPISIDGNITNPIIKKLIKPLTPKIMKSLELCIFPVQADMSDCNNFVFRIPTLKNRVFFSMWESTALPQNIVQMYNSGLAIIVPNNWNQMNFKTDGVNVPIIKCPLFVDTDVYKYRPPIHNNCFVFGTGNADPRKRLDSVMRCFCKAFAPNKKDVRLNVKIDNSGLSKITRFSDDRIYLNTQKMTKQELAEWYHSLDCFVSGASAEGWGLEQFEAMACGRPCVMCEYAGVKEYFNSDNGITVDFDEVFCEQSWGYSNGFWSKFNEDDMISKLRWCYNNPNDVIKYGKKSAKRALQFTTDIFANKLVSILEDFQ